MFSSTKRKRSHQEQLAEDSLFLDGPSVDELQTIQKRKDPECSRDTQVKNQALHDYVDGLTITMNVIQPSSASHPHRMCYKCGQKGHYAKSCPQRRLSPAPQQAGQQGRPAQPRTPAQGRVNHVTAESAAEAPNMVLGMFMVNSHPATVLFDTGATHSFITKSYVEQYSFFTTPLREVSASLFTGRGVEIPYC